MTISGMRRGAATPGSGRSVNGELTSLARELLGRVEVLDELEWRVSRERAAPASPRGSRPIEEDAAAADVRSPLAALQREVENCRKCPLGAQRIRPAFGVGSPGAEVMLVGEGPGYEEDRRGEPFVGKAGELLDRILASIGFSRRTVYIANIVKCHPMVDPSKPEKRGNDRPPSPEEIASCRDYLDEQIRLVRPRVLVTLGAVAAKVMLGTAQGITRLRGIWREYAPFEGDPIPLLPTYHPAALLRNPELKRDVWTDMKDLKRALEAGHERD
ncbi:MAG: uracil-DNA glycosylase [Elusimicrobiota bacterium]